jgi:hypothetical protein
MSQTDEQFAKILIEAVDCGLLILGESSRKAILFHLEKDYSITKEKIPERMEAFMKGLESIFGVGAIVIEKSISEHLYSELGAKYEGKRNYRFVDCVKQAKKMWSESSRM